MIRVVLFFILFTWLPYNAFSQLDTIDSSIDNKYREDQFYAGFSYSMLSKLPDDTRLRGLSGSIQLGFLRDFPLNKRRNVALAAGVGLNFNRYGQNLFIGNNNNSKLIYRILGKEGPVKYSTNRLGTYIIELPVQLRWRTSTAEKYQFWRVYAGLTAGYIYWSQSKFKQDGNKVIVTNISDLQRLRWSASLSFGYNKINLFDKYVIYKLFNKDVCYIDICLI